MVLGIEEGEMLDSLVSQLAPTSLNQFVQRPISVIAFSSRDVSFSLIASITEGKEIPSNFSKSISS